MKTGRTWHTSNCKIERSNLMTQVSCFDTIYSPQNDNALCPISKFLKTLSNNSNQMTDEDLIVESNYLLPKVASQYGFEFSEFETYNQLKYMFLSLVNSLGWILKSNQNQFQIKTSRKNKNKDEVSINKRSSTKKSSKSKKLQSFSTKILNCDDSSENHIFVNEIDELQIDLDIGQLIESIKKDSQNCKKCPMLLQCYDNLMETLIQFQDQRQLQFQKLKQMNIVVSNTNKENQNLSKQVQKVKHQLQVMVKVNQNLKQQLQDQKKLHQQIVIADSLSTIYQSPQLQTRFLLIQALSIQSMLPKHEE